MQGIGDGWVDVPPCDQFDGGRGTKDARPSRIPIRLRKV